MCNTEERMLTTQEDNYLCSKYEQTQDFMKFFSTPEPYIVNPASLDFGGFIKKSPFEKKTINKSNTINHALDRSTTLKAWNVPKSRSEGYEEKGKGTKNSSPVKSKTYPLTVLKRQVKPRQRIPPSCFSTRPSSPNSNGNPYETIIKTHFSPFYNQTKSNKILEEDYIDDDEDEDDNEDLDECSNELSSELRRKSQWIA